MHRNLLLKILLYEYSLIYFIGQGGLNLIAAVKFTFTLYTVVVGAKNAHKCASYSSTLARVPGFNLVK